MKWTVGDGRTSHRSIGPFDDGICMPFGIRIIGPREEAAIMCLPAQNAELSQIATLLSNRFRMIEIFIAIQS